MPDLQKLLADAIEIAKIGGQHTLKYFRNEIKVLSKDDDSPVTIADRETEQTLRREIAKRYPDHGIIGEEFERTNADSRIQWVLDPIDGTKSFIHGVPLYTTLVAVLVDDKPVVGVIYASALDELCAAAEGHGATFNGKKCAVRETENLEDATLLVTEIRRFQDMGEEALFQELLKTTKIHRTWGDAYGHMMVATGRADIMYDPEMSIWDAAALQPIIKEAGGVFTDKNGVETVHTGSGLSTGKKIHPQVKALFESYL